MTTVGVISDTHGLLRPEACTALAGSEIILHAGDIGRLEVLEQLRTIAPVIAVRGNVDRGEWADSIPADEWIQVDQTSIYLLHDLAELALDPTAAGLKMVISGHSHQPKIAEHNGVLYLNPGSAGPRRFKLPVVLGIVEISGARARARIVDLL